MRESSILSWPESMMVAFILFGLVAVGCGGKSSNDGHNERRDGSWDSVVSVDHNVPTDGLIETDGSTVLDAAQADAAQVDASHSDAAQADASQADGSVVSDGSTPDAFVLPDAFVFPDIFVFPDSSTPVQNTDGIMSLAIDPADTQVLYAGTSYVGVYMTQDGGASWSAMNNGVPMSSTTLYETINAVAIDIHNGNRPAALIENDYYVFAGGTWTLTNQGAWPPNFVADRAFLYYHPTDPQILYSAGSVLTRSQDGGLNWTNLLGSTYGDLSEIAFAPSSPNVIFAAGHTTRDRLASLYKSTNGGTSFTASDSGITASVIFSVAVDPQVPANLYAGDDAGHVFRSHDGGATWSAASVGYYGMGVVGIVVDPNDPFTLHLVTEAGEILSSSNGGVSFDEVLYDGIFEPECITMPPTSSDTLYVGSGDGLYKGVRSGATWSFTLYTAGLPNAMMDLAVDPANPANLWAGLKWEGVYRSVDGGQTWTLAGLGDAWFVEAVAVNPVDSSEILAGSEYYMQGGRIYKSQDNGATWSLKAQNIPAVTKLRYHPFNPLQVYATTLGGGVLRSLDGGETWGDYSNGIYYPVLDALAITFEPSPILLTGTFGSGLYRSPVSADTANHGDWQSFPVYSGEMTSIAMHSTNSQVLYVGTRDAGVFKTTDGGVSWQPARQGIGYLPIRSLVVDPQNGDVVYAGTDYGEVYRSSNGGSSWTACGVIDDMIVYALVVDPSDSYIIYVGIAGGNYLNYGNIYKSVDGCATWTVSDSGIPRV